MGTAPVVSVCICVWPTLLHTQVLFNRRSALTKPIIFRQAVVPNYGCWWRYFLQVAPAFCVMAACAAGFGFYIRKCVFEIRVGVFYYFISTKPWRKRSNWKSLITWMCVCVWRRLSAYAILSVYLYLWGHTAVLKLLCLCGDIVQWGIIFEV